MQNRQREGNRGRRNSSFNQKERDIFRKERENEREKEKISSWAPKTKVGRLVKEGKIKSMDELLEKGIVILEDEIVDSLLKLNSEFIFIGQSKGKFGGGKRRIWKQTQKKTKEGNISTFACLAVVGDGNGHIGLGYGRSKETLPAREKALRKAKLNIIKIDRGCGSFDCSCHELHTIPMKSEGKCASVEIKLFPAPQGTGLVVGDEVKKVLRLAGIKDIYGKTFGKVRTSTNLIKATIGALKKAKIKENKE